MRKIALLFSVILHIALIYVVFNAQFQIKIVKIGEEITAVSLIATDGAEAEAKAGLHAPKIEPGAGQKLVFGKPSISISIGRPPGFSFSPGSGTPGKGRKPGLLLTPDQTKDSYFVDPSAGIKPQDNRDFFKYLYPYRSYAYPGFSKISPLEGTPSPGYGNGGAAGSYLPQRKGVGIDMNAGGFNIRPWAKKALNKVQENWQVPTDLRLTPKTSVSVGVLVTIEKSGMISAAEIKKDSKEKSLDQSALMALNSCSPLPELPGGFPLKNLEAYFLFHVENE
jgi:TonB family protein